MLDSMVLLGVDMVHNYYYLDSLLGSGGRRFPVTLVLPFGPDHGFHGPLTATISSSDLVSFLHRRLALPFVAWILESSFWDSHILGSKKGKLVAVSEDENWRRA